MSSTLVHFDVETPAVSIQKLSESEAVVIQGHSDTVSIFVHSARDFLALLGRAVEQMECAEQTRAIGEQFLEGMEAVEGEA